MSVVINGSTGISLVQSGAVPPASVLQVVSTLSATQSSQVITAVDTQVGQLTHTITPKGNNSKFLVTARWVGEAQNAWDVLFNIQMDGTRVNVNGQGRGCGLASPSQSYPVGDNNSSTPENSNITALVETSSIIGTPITFKLVADTTSSITLWTNRCFLAPAAGVEVGTSEIIVMEIAA